MLHDTCDLCRKGSHSHALRAERVAGRDCEIRVKNMVSSRVSRVRLRAGVNAGVSLAFRTHVLYETGKDLSSVNSQTTAKVSFPSTEYGAKFEK